MTDRGRTPLVAPHRRGIGACPGVHAPRAARTFGVALAASTFAACAIAPRTATHTHSEVPMATAARPTPSPADDNALPSPAGRDQTAVAAVVTAIAEGADLHQWTAVRAAFAPEVRLDYGTPEQLTPAAVVGRWQPLLEALDATQHQVSDLAVRVDGDRATTTSRFQATHVLRGASGGDVWVLTGRYEHALVRTPAGWQVTAMRMVPEGSSGNATLIDQARARAAGPPAGRRAPASPDVAADTAGERERNRATVRAFFATLEALGSGEQVAALFAEDGRQVMPFAPGGFPRTLDGRGAIARQYGGLPAAYTAMRFPDLVVRDLASPTEFFATYRGDITLQGGGKYDNEYAGHFVVRGGRIVEFTEYFNPIVLQRAFGDRLQGTFSVPR
jgi:ketosteroid isomerase-like protein